MQVAYLRGSSWPTLCFDGKEVPIFKVVTKHFRDIDNIRLLGKKAGLDIEIMRNDFIQNSRKEYTEAVCQKIKKQSQREIVFLDPDTGLAKENAKGEHVESGELSSIWHSMKLGDFLVLYQHNPHLPGWRNVRKKDVAKAINVEESAIKMWEASEKIKDVVFFYCEKC